MQLLNSQYKLPNKIYIITFFVDVQEMWLWIADQQKPKRQG